MKTQEIEEALDENRTSLDGLKVYINVWNLAASLAVAKGRRDERGRYYEQVKSFEDLESLGLEYRDLVDAVEAQGMINRSGWYALSAKIRKAVFDHKDVVLALFTRKSD